MSEVAAMAALPAPGVVLAQGVMPEWLRVVGLVALSLLAAVAVLGAAERARAWCMLGALLLAPVLLVAEIWGGTQLTALSERPALAGAGVAAGLVAVAGLAVLFSRRPGAFALAAVAALPFRLPVQVGASTANLLLPLYVVVAAGALAWLVPRLRAPADGPTGEERSAGWLEWLLMGAVVLYAVQTAYSSNPTKALQQVVLFYVPFALLFARLRALAWSPRLLAACFGVLVVLALVFAGIGFVEYATRHLLLNPKVIASNQIEEYFRVNSLFFDPNIYGRFLVVVMLGLAAVLIWFQRPAAVVGAAVALAVLAGGLLLTLSQSSFAALLAGLGTLALLRWRARWTLLAVGLIVAAGLALVLAAPKAVGVDLSDRASIDDATSGRVELIDGGLRLSAERQALGWGSASFEREYRRLEGTSSARATAASHTIPITVAAEQGLVGLIVYLALLAAALMRLFRGIRSDLFRPARPAIAAAFVALAVHTWMYAAFLEDPMAWALLGIGSALAAFRAP